MFLPSPIAEHVLQVLGVNCFFLHYNTMNIVYSPYPEGLFLTQHLLPGPEVSLLSFSP